MTLILQGTDNSVSSPAVQGGTAGTTTGVYYPSTNQIALATNGTLGLIQDANRNIGLGITPNSSWNTFSVIESGYAGNSFFGQTGASQVGMGFNSYYSSGWKYANSSTAASLYYQLAGVHTFVGAPSGTAGNAVSYTQLLAFQRGFTLALEGASSQAGTGITFPATQSASSDANTLDDYEEGSWTPSISGVTAGVASGQYVKVGNAVVFWGRITYSSGTPNAAAATIAGLPFSTNSNNRSPMAVSQANSINFGGSSTMLVGFISNAQINLFGNTNNAGYSSPPATTWFGAGSFLEFGGAYTVY